MKKRWLTIALCTSIFLIFAVFLAFAQTELKNTGDYNKTAKSMTIYDEENKTLSVVKLISEHPRTIYNKDDYVMEIEIDNKAIYTDFLNKIDLKNNLTQKKIYRDITFKFFNDSGSHNETIYEYETLGNGTKVMNGSHQETIAGSWDYFNIDWPIKAEKIRIRFYDKGVKANEIVDLIPTFYGIEIKEWAVYHLAEHYDVNDNTWVRIHSGTYSAQVFTPTADMELGVVEIKAYSQGAEGTLYGFIVNTTTGTSAGAPDNTSIIATFTNISDGDWNGTALWHNLTFSDNNASLCNNCSYAILFRGTGANDGNEYSWRIDSVGATYTYGNKWGRSTGFQWSEVAGGDTMFRTYRIGDSPPTISQSYPIDNANFSSVPTFSLIADDDNSISHCHLYGNWTGSWHKNMTNTSVVAGSQTNFTFSGSPEGKFIWGGWTNDSANQGVWTTNNYTFVIDPTHPNNTIVSPTGTGASLSFIVNTSSADTYGIYYCMFNITTLGGGTEVANTNMTEHYTGYFNASSSVTTDGTYNLDVVCFDYFTKNQNHTSGTFTISSGVGAVGGGGGVAEEEEELITAVSICVPFKTAFLNVWETAKEEKDLFEKIKLIWISWWDFILCKSASSIVPI